MHDDPVILMDGVGHDGRRRGDNVLDQDSDTHVVHKRRRSLDCGLRLLLVVAEEREIRVLGKSVVHEQVAVDTVVGLDTK